MNSSWEANRPSSSQEIPRILWNLKVNYRIQKTCSYPEPDQSSPCRPIHTSWRSILLLFYHLCLGLKWSLSLMSRHENPVCPSPSVTILRLYISWHKLTSFESSQIWLIPSLRCASPRNCVNPIPFIYYLLLADKPTSQFRNAPLNAGFQSFCYRYSTTKYVVKSDKAIGQVDWEISVTRTVQILCKLFRRDIGWKSSLKRRLERLNSS